MSQWVSAIVTPYISPLVRHCIRLRYYFLVQESLGDTVGELRLSALLSNRPYSFTEGRKISRKSDVMTSPIGSGHAQHDYATKDNPKSAAWLLFEVRQQYLRMRQIATCV